MINRPLRLGTAEIERLICDPQPLGSLELLMPRVLDAWALEFPGLATLPRYEGEAGPMRVCIATEDVVGPVRNGGIGTTYAALAHLLAGMGFDTTILYLKGTDVENGTIDEWVKHYGASGIKFVPVPNYAQLDRFQTGADRWLRAPYNMMRYLLDNPMDVVHVSEWRGSGYLSLLAKRQGLAFQKTLFIVKTSSPWMWNRLYGSQPLDRLEDLAKVQAERRSVEYADVVIGGSLHLLKWMASQGYEIPRQRTFVQPNVVTFDHLQGLISKRQSAPGTRRKIDEIVFFGRLEARKGLFIFCQAIKRLIRLGVKLPPTISFMGKPGARLTARPDQDILDYIATETASWPVQVKVLTEFQQYQALEYLLGGERLAVMPSMIENSSLAVYEAAMCGIPFVASSSGGTPELIAEQDHRHVLCDAHPLTFADSIAEALDLGGYIAHPSFDNDTNLEEWRRFHLDLSRGLADTLRKPTIEGDDRPINISACIYHTGDVEQLRATLVSLAEQSKPLSEIVVAVDADDLAASDRVQAIVDELGVPARIVDTYDFDAGLAFNKAAETTSGDYLFFAWAGATLKPEGLAALSQMARSSRADVVNYFYRVVHMPGSAQHDHLRATIFSSFSEAFFRTDLTSMPLFVRREAFFASAGFSCDYRVLGCDHEFVARAQVGGFRCETALLELGSVPAWDPEWLKAKCYDQSIGQFRAVRPQLAAVPLALRELILMAKGLQVRTSAAKGGGKARASAPADFKQAASQVAVSRNPLAKLFSRFNGADVHAPKINLAAAKAKTYVFDEVHARDGYKDAALVSMSNQLRRFVGASGKTYHGEVLAVHGEQVYGWLKDESNPGKPVNIGVIGENGLPVRSARISADLPLLVTSGRADIGNYGFTIDLRRHGPAALLRRSGERVTLQISGEGITLAEVFVARSRLNVAQAGLDGYCDGSDTGVVRGWVWNPMQPKVNYDIAIFIDGRFFSRVSAVKTRDDLISSGIGDGNYGFQVPIPKALRNGDPHIVDAVLADYGLLLKRGRLIVRGSLVTYHK